MTEFKETASATAGVPLHETHRVAGVTENCRFNDHTMCHSSQCACDCHRPVAATVAPVHSSVADPNLIKSCARCNMKRPAGEVYCRKCGGKLGSLQCMGCRTVCDEGDLFCYNCSYPLNSRAVEIMQAENRDLPEVAPLPPPPPAQTGPPRVPAAVIAKRQARQAIPTSPLAVDGEQLPEITIDPAAEKELQEALEQLRRDGHLASVSPAAVEATIPAPAPANGLPKGMFKESVAAPVAGQQRKQVVPFNPKAQ